MKNNHIPNIKYTFVVLLTFLIVSTIQAETSFTYQGQLSQSGQAADGLYDMTFKLYDDLRFGTQQGITLNKNNVDVSQGIFDVSLDFGDAPFNDAPRYLEIAVREAGSGAFTTLFPRQHVGASPFAIETLYVAPGGVDTAAIQNGAVTRTKLGLNAVGSNQIEDGSLLPADIDGNIYNKKGSVYVRTQTGLVGFGIQSVNVACDGARDLLINHVCNVPSDNSDITILSERLTSVDNDVNSVRLRCTGENRDPQNTEVLTATVWCLAVD